MFCGALAILLDFFVEASYELVSVQVPETYVVSPSKIGKDLFQFGGTEHRRFKLAVFVFVLDKPPGLALQDILKHSVLVGKYRSIPKVT